jgi:dihydrofolate reductase
MDGIRPEGNVHMSKLILKMSVSLDGFVARTDGRNDWIFPSMSDDAAAWTLDAISQASAHLMGAETYRAMAAYWPQSSEIFAAPMNDIPKVVFSTTLTTADWGDTSIAAGDLAEEIKRLKQEAGGDLVAHGGTRLAQSLCKSGLIDELWLLVHPVVLGNGQRLFVEPMDLEPITTTAFTGGAVAHVCRPV